MLSTIAMMNPSCLPLLLLALAFIDYGPIFCFTVDI
jgi:hypothetical protein